tara:strand:- start:193 stop:471 length:279 start_codon:yes stop_codon:yes gene_type:complete
MEKYTNSLANDERETYFTQVAEDRHTWIVYSDDPVWVARFEKMGLKWEPEGVGRQYTLSTEDFTVSIRPKRQLSEEERTRRADQMRNIRVLP